MFDKYLEKLKTFCQTTVENAVEKKISNSVEKLIGSFTDTVSNVVVSSAEAINRKVEDTGNMLVEKIGNIKTDSPNGKSDSSISESASNQKKEEQLLITLN